MAKQLFGVCRTVYVAADSIEDALQESWGKEPVTIAVISDPCADWPGPCNCEDFTHTLSRPTPGDPTDFVA